MLKSSYMRENIFMSVCYIRKEKEGIEMKDGKHEENIWKLCENLKTEDYLK